VNRPDAPRRAPLDLRGIPPERVTQPARAAFVWFSIVFAWLISLLPWRVWEGAPDVLLLTLAFWCVRQPNRVGFLTAFVLGLLMDVHDSGLFGEMALRYVLVAYGATALHRRLQRFDLLGQALHLAPVFFAAGLVTTLLHAWLALSWPGWDWALGAVLTAALYPILGWVLQLSFRGDHDGNNAAA